VRRVQQSIFGQFVNVTPCDRCKGEGQIVQHKCQECNGNGRVRRVRKVAVTVPAGVDNGMEMRLSGQGEGGDRGGPNGDLYVQLQVEPHPFLKRDGVDLVYELPLNVAQAALGAEVQVPTLEGHETLRVPPGTQHGRVFRVRDKGVPRLQRAGRGDFRVVAHVEVPTTLSDRQRDLFAQLADTFAGVDAPAAGVDGSEHGGIPQRAKPSKGKGLFEKVKEAIGLDDE
jgi:molecular chaperone DnaJ